MDRDLKQVLTVFAVIISFGGGYFLNQWQNSEKIELGEKFAIFGQIDDFLSKNSNTYILDEAKAIQDAVNAYYDNSSDKYFEYVSNHSVTSKENQINNSDMLIDNGFQIKAQNDGCMLIVKVEEDSYAESQGLCEGDIITDIDGTALIEIGFSLGASKILGKNGTVAEITLIRDGKTVELIYNRKYEKSAIATSYKMIDDICYINYTETFNKTNYGVFGEAKSDLGDSAKAIIVDLRNNRGGEKQIALKILDEFLGECEVFHAYFENGESEHLSTKLNGDEFVQPLVILMNENSASASEIVVAGLKQYYGNVVLIGTNTFGKALCQTDNYFTSEDKIHYTAGYCIIGDWECYQDVGIAPDIEVEMDSELIGTDEDIQLQAAIDYLNGGQID